MAYADRKTALPSSLTILLLRHRIALSCKTLHHCAEGPLHRVAATAGLALFRSLATARPYLQSPPSACHADRGSNGCRDGNTLIVTSVTGCPRAS